MGRDVGESCIDEKSSVVDTAVDSREKSEKNDHNSRRQEKQEEVVLAGHELEEKIIEAEVQNLTEMKLSSPVKNAAASAINEMTNGNPPCSHSPELEKRSVTHTNANIVERKHHYDEDDSWSLSSSTATSVRTAKITVPVAPRFNCVDRLQRRKEFYSKLDEKHQALEKEKHEYEARIKEEDQAALKLLRKNMSYKANPVPRFYREGPPAKVELKKIPVTRAKSPNFTRRKSCGDAAAVVKASPPIKRHSIGATKASPLGSKSKPQNGSPSPNSSKLRATRRQMKETPTATGEG